MTDLSYCIHVLSPTGYQLYKKRCQHGSADADSEAPSLEGDQAKVKDYAMENNAFDFDENSSNEVKNRDITHPNTQMWDHQGSYAGRKSVDLVFSHFQVWIKKQKAFVFPDYCPLFSKI